MRGIMSGTPTIIGTITITVGATRTIAGVVGHHHSQPVAVAVLVEAAAVVAEAVAHAEVAIDSIAVNRSLFFNTRIYEF
jgi:hypothetical protein